MKATIKDFKQYEIKKLNQVKGGQLVYAQYEDHYTIHDCYVSGGSVHCTFIASYPGGIC
jgi:hypothetical protein